MFKKLLPSQLLWGITLWTLPFSIFTVVWQNAYFLQGSYNPYLSFSVYLSEIFVAATFVAWLIEKFLKSNKLNFHKKSWLLAGGILGLSLLSVLFSQDKITSLLGNIHILSGLMAMLLMAHQVTPHQKTKQIFISALVFQSVVGIFQVITQKSIGLSFLGEPLIGPEIAGVAKLNIAGKTLVRAYGTLPHANLLAGFLGIGILMAHKLPKHKLWQISKVLLWTGFFLTFSKGAIIALFLALTITKRLPLKIAAPILGISLVAFVYKWDFFLLSESFIERLQYLKISLGMLANEPVGVGLTQFTARLQEFSTIKLQPWQYQPVHNIYLLVANELGLWSGLALIGGLGYALRQLWHHKIATTIIIFIIIIGLFDHYLISLPQGILLSGGLLGLTNIKK